MFFRRQRQHNFVLVITVNEQTSPSNRPALQQERPPIGETHATQAVNRCLNLMRSSQKLSFHRMCEAGPSPATSICLSLFGRHARRKVVAGS